MDFTGLVFQYLPWAVGFVLLVATGFFFGQFFLPSRRLYKQLDAAIRKLNEVKKRQGDAPIVDLAEIKSVMATDELRYLWSEYTETLHPQKKPDDSGQLKIIRYRATAMAEVFFIE